MVSYLASGNMALARSNFLCVTVGLAGSTPSRAGERFQEEPSEKLGHGDSQ